MFGWELPPYNSGGLGTASLGLTEGLVNAGVDIRFVVPKLLGKLPYDHMEVVSASDYSTPAEIERLLHLTEVEQELIHHSLAYGAQAVSIDEQRRVWIEHMRNGGVPLSPKTQAVWYAHQARAIAKEGEYDVIHSHDWMTYYGGMAAQKVARTHGKEIPHIAHVHATEIDRCGHNGDPGILEIERKGLHSADHVVAVSHYTKEVVHKNYDIPRHKISVVYNGIPAHKQPQRFDLHEMKKHHKIVLFMGRITMQKGPDYFVKLAHAVSQKDPSIRFVMVGSGDMEKRCIEESAALGLTGKMLFSSFLRGSDVDRAYQLADLFVMPSVSEPFGIVALEAIQNGTPVLVSKQSGVAEVSENIVKVDFWDIKNMSEAVLKVVHDQDHKQGLLNGASQDLNNLSWNHAALTMKDVYHNILTPGNLRHA